MAQLQEQIDALSRRISEMAAQQSNMRKELLVLMDELRILQQQANRADKDAAYQPLADVVVKPDPVIEKVTEVKEVITAPGYKPPVSPMPTGQRPAHRPLKPKSTSNKAGTGRTGTSIEEFVGKNLASKIGILITIIGVFIFARYAIEHNLVSPVVRILSGYLGGLALIGIAIRLKKKYEAYSAVLMGGGLCVMYFITFIAWSVYQLFPQLAAFGLMLLFTAAIIVVAIWYNRVIIAHLGQVGAYAIPFLLSNDSGNYAALFTYIGIINAGILVLSFFKNWRSLFHIAYILTWLVYATWFGFEYSDRHFALAATVLTIYFLMFYATFLSYKLVKKEKYDLRDIFLLLSNAFMFYGFGYALLDDHAAAKNWPGIFTVANALIHLVVSFLLRKRLEVTDRSLYYMVLGLVVVFLTIAVPVQLDGNWVTLLWMGEGVLLFYIGRTRNTVAYEKLAAGLVLLGIISLLHDWVVFHQHYPPARAFMNINFMTGLLVAAALAFIVRLNARHKTLSGVQPNVLFQSFYDYAVAAVLLVITYALFFLEISLQFRWLDSKEPTGTGLYNISEIARMGSASLLLYSQLFLVVLFIVNKRLKSHWLAITGLLCTLFVCLVMLVAWPGINELTWNYFNDAKEANYFGVGNLLIRYLIVAALAGLLVNATHAVRTWIKEPMLQQAWWLTIYTMIVAALSYEYLTWTDIARNEAQYKTGLSVVWGLSALALVVYGIWKKQKYVRLYAIGLFVITILKLFFYDLSEAGTITKTISFITLGVILLLVSYLYNRYKDALFGQPEADSHQQQDGH